jgi:hypothetical protein
MLFFSMFFTFNYQAFSISQPDTCDLVESPNFPLSGDMSVFEPWLTLHARTDAVPPIVSLRRSGVGVRLGRGNMP